ncbi:MAG: EF-P lysine aminoacylase EpmA [Planctomycetota bacterium]
MAADPIAVLRERAALVARTRAFFAARDVLEVDTPLLGDGLVVEAHIDPIPCRVRLGAEGEVARHLLTSPEAPMKRLLAAGSGPIYQFAHAFRDGEVGRRHAVEFTMLEWYRPGFDHRDLMGEVEALVQELLPGAGHGSFERCSYRELFVQKVQVDPFATSLPELRAACARVGVDVPDGFDDGTLDDALDLLLVSHVEPRLGRGRPLFVHGYPPSQAALAQVRSDGDGPPSADRFELYVDGVELANGYHELADADEQRRRFEQANRDRIALGRPALPVDEDLLAALAAGLPPCAGVALGFDRLVMLALGRDRIDDVRP